MWLKYLISFCSVIVFLISLTESQNNKILLRDVTSLTLQRGEYTTGRRSNSIPQIECVGGTAKGRFSPKVVQCYNRGFNGIDVQWECKSQMSSDFEFGKIEVSCEGYDYNNDPYILAGSCGLKYELDFSVSGAKRHAYSPSLPTKGINSINIVYFIIACFVIYLIYTSLTAPREGHEGDRSQGGSGFDYGPGHPPGGGGAPPPGWRDPPPSYNDSAKYNNTRNCGAAGNTGNSGPGFFTGMGLGALGGYLFGNSNSGYDGRTYRRRNYFGRSSQFERDTGFYDQPSTSYFGNNEHESTSSSIHNSSGFGGTSRR